MAPDLEWGEGKTGRGFMAALVMLVLLVLLPLPVR